MKQTVLRIVVAARIQNEGEPKPVDVVIDADYSDLLSDTVQRLLEAALPELTPN